MVRYFDEIPQWLINWIEKQKIFWVASAPLDPNGLVNISPKGMAGSFHIIDSHTMWYEDLTGSGIETVANARENGRITVLFNAFEGPPQITRLFGKAQVYEFGTPEYDAILPPEKRLAGSRAIIMISIFKVSTTCGYSIPFFTYKSERNRLMNLNCGKEESDIKAEESLEAKSLDEPPLPERGLKRYWTFQNGRSLNGLPGMETGFKSLQPFFPHTRTAPDDEREPGMIESSELKAGEVKLAAAFLTGVVLTVAYMRLVMTH